MLESKRTALINIDFINDIVHEEGAYKDFFSSLVKERKVIEKANEVIQFARANNVLNIYVKVGFSEDYREISPQNAFFGKSVAKNALRLGTWGTEFHKDLDYQPHETVVVKHRISPLYGTNLECILTANRINQLIITGVATDLAVQMLARDAIDRDMQVIICQDACSTFTNEIQEATLQSLARMSRVIGNEELRQDLLI